MVSIFALVVVLKDEGDAQLTEREPQAQSDVPANPGSMAAEEAVASIVAGALDNRGRRKPANGKSDAIVGTAIASLALPTEATGRVSEVPEGPETTSKPAWRQFAALWPHVDKPILAIVIDDLGLSEEATLTLARMQGPYTLAFLPYADNLGRQTSLMKQAGHELMVHMPMQPKSNDADPGKNALLTDLTPEEFDRRLEWNLSRFEGYVGINNHMGSELTEDAGAMVRVMVRLRAKRHLFLDSLTSPKSVGTRAARATGVSYIARDIFLDNVREENAVLEQLAKAERIALRRGYAVAIGHPYDVTLETLQAWRATLERRGFALVPLSQIMAEKQAQRPIEVIGGEAR